ncbi:MAG TPA: ATP-binding protein [Cyclobacteriaceae bacterium]
MTASGEIHNNREFAQVKAILIGISIVIALSGLLNLLGWKYDIEILKRPIQDFDATNPLTAILFLMFGISMVLVHLNKISKKIGLIIGALIIIISVFHAMDIILQTGVNIDKIIFSDNLESDLSDYNNSNRMAFNIALSFVLLGTIFLLSAGNTRKKKIANELSLVIILIGAISLLLSAFRFEKVLELQAIIPMGAYSACLLILCALAIIVSNYNVGFMKIILAKNSGGRFARIYIPISFMGPLLMGYAGIILTRETFLNIESSFAIIIVLATIIYFLVTLQTASLLSSKESLQKDAKKYISEYELGMRQVIEQSPSPLIAVDKRGAIQIVNAEARDLFQYQEKELLGKKVEVLIPESMNQKHESYRDKYMKNPVSRPMGKLLELKGKKKNGEEFPLEIALKPIQFKSESDVLIAASILDITMRKEQEILIRDLHANLEDKIKERTAQLEDANRELESFAYSVSHDLRAPLRALEGFSKLLFSKYGESFDTESARWLKYINENAIKMDILINDILHFSRVNRKELIKGEFDIRNLIEEVMEECLQPYAGKPMDVDLNIEHPIINGDRQALRMVWQNLIGNALKFSSKEDVIRIKIKVKKAGKIIQCSIEDNGAGFDMKYSNKLFGVFERLHKESEYEGTGIGLAIVNKIVKKHNGRIWAKSKVGKGAKFTFECENVSEIHKPTDSNPIKN